MAEKNPYENGVYIPDFVDKNEKDVDMTSFKMDLDDIQQSSKYDYDENDSEDDEDFDDESNGSNGRSSLIVCIVIIIILILAAVSGWIFGITKKNELTQAIAERTEIEQKLIAANEKISSLEAASKEDEPDDTTDVDIPDEETESYMADGVINVRESAGSKTYADGSKLSDDIKESLNVSEDAITTKTGVVYKVYETETVDGMLWGRIDKAAWFCLDYATKQ